jgi:hypothetical protein
MKNNDNNTTVNSTHLIFPCDVDFMKKRFQQSNCSALFDLRRKETSTEYQYDCGANYELTWLDTYVNISALFVHSNFSVFIHTPIKPHSSS